MKKLLLILLSLLMFVFFAKSTVLADEGSASAMVSPTPVAASNYTLPYPGLLPNNPLYFLKIIRDQVVMFFISDPLKKSDFLLLQADKRLEASWYLFKEGAKQNDLALSTLTKSTNYLYDALAQLKQAQGSGQDITDLRGRLHDAILKHEQTVVAMENFAGLTKNPVLVAEEKRLADLEKSVLAVIPR